MPALVSLVCGGTAGCTSWTHFGHRASHVQHCILRGQGPAQQGGRQRTAYGRESSQSGTLRLPAVRHPGLKLNIPP